MFSHFDLWNSLYFHRLMFEAWQRLGSRYGRGETTSQSLRGMKQWCSGWHDKPNKTDLCFPLSSLTRYCLNIQNAWFSHHSFRHFSFWGPYWIFINLINYIRMIRNRQAIRLESRLYWDENKYYRSTHHRPSFFTWIVFPSTDWLDLPNRNKPHVFRNRIIQVAKWVQLRQTWVHFAWFVYVVCAQKSPIVFN